MVAPPPPPPPPPLSFAEALTNRQNGGLSDSPRSIAKSFALIQENGGKIALKKPSLYRGKPAVFFSKDEVEMLASPFRYTLVGKFLYSRPPMEVVRNFFVSLGLKSLQSVGLLQENHIVIFINNEEDYSRLLLRATWYISGAPLKISKWSPDFIPSLESPVVPVWVGLPGLPIHFFEKSALFSLASAFGVPLKIDEPTARLSRPTVARICVEVDVSKPQPERLWIGNEKQGFWQNVVFENLPGYCNFCQMLGHQENNCFIKNPVLKKSLVIEETRNSIPVVPKVNEKLKAKEKLGEGEWQVVKRKTKKSEADFATLGLVTKVSNGVSFAKASMEQKSEQSVPIQSPGSKNRQGKQKDFSLQNSFLDKSTDLHPVLSHSTIYLTPFNQKKDQSKSSVPDKSHNQRKELEAVPTVSLPLQNFHSCSSSQFPSKEEALVTSQPCILKGQDETFVDNSPVIPNVERSHLSRQLVSGVAENLPVASFENKEEAVSIKIGIEREEIANIHPSYIECNPTSQPSNCKDKENFKVENTLVKKGVLPNSPSKVKIGEDFLSQVKNELINNEEEKSTRSTIVGKDKQGLVLDKVTPRELSSNGLPILQGKEMNFVLDSGKAISNFGPEFVQLETTKPLIDFKGIEESSATNQISSIIDKLFADGKTWEKLRRSKRNKKKKILLSFSLFVLALACFFFFFLFFKDLN